MSVKKLLLFLFVLIVVIAGSYFLLSAVGGKSVDDEVVRLKSELAASDKQVSLLQGQLRDMKQGVADTQLIRHKYAELKKRLPAEKVPLTDEEAVKRVAELKDMFYASIENRDVKEFYETIVAFVELDEAAYPYMAKVALAILEAGESGDGEETEKGVEEMFSDYDNPVIMAYQAKLQALLTNPKAQDFMIYLAKQQEYPAKFREEMVGGVVQFSGDNPKVAKMLMELVETEANVRVLTEAIEALGRLDMYMAEALPILKRKVDDSKAPASIRTAALKAIDRIGGEQAKAIVKSYVNSSDPDLRKVASRYSPEEIKRREDQEQFRILKRKAERLVYSSKVLMNNEAVIQVIANIATTDPDAATRLSAFSLVKSMPQEVAVPIIIKGMEGQSAKVRLGAVAVLGSRFRGAESTAVLKQIATSDADEEVRRLAEYYLDRR
jgi:hypothetical protein